MLSFSSLSHVATRSAALAVLLVAAIAVSCASESPTPTPTVEPTPTPGFKFLSLQAWLSPPRLKAGDTFSVNTDAGGSGLAQYTLTINDTRVSVVRWDGEHVQDNVSTAVEVVSWEAGPGAASWQLKAVEPGEYTITIFVTGEVGATPGGPFYFTSGTQQFSLSVTAAE